MTVKRQSEKKLCHCDFFASSYEHCEHRKRPRLAGARFMIETLIRFGSLADIGGLHNQPLLCAQIARQGSLYDVLLWRHASICGSNTRLEFWSPPWASSDRTWVG